MQDRYSTVIKAGRGEAHYWRDLWRFRELLAFLVWRDVLVRYKQTVVGIAWAVLRPLLTMVIFTIVFGKIAGLPSRGVPYPVLVFAALLPWQFFSTSIADASQSLIGNASLVSKVYFPRLILPVSSIATAAVDLAISVVLLLILMFFYGLWPSIRLMVLPILAVLAVMAALGPGLLMAALSVRYRDFRYVVPFCVQMGLYISPVGFTSDVVPAQWRMVYSLNPMVGVIDGFRWAVCGTPYFYWPGFVVSMAVMLAILAIGVWYFRRTERTFADVI